MVIGNASSEHSGVAVLLIDTLVARRDLLEVVIESPAVGAVVVGTATGVPALEAVAAIAPDVVLLEIQLPVEKGMETLSALRRSFPSLPVVVCSFRSDDDTKARALAGGAAAFIDKPVGTKDLRDALGAAAGTTRPRSGSPGPA